MKRVVAVLTGVVLLAGCGRSSDETPLPEPPADAPALPPADFSVPLRAVGTEPFWALDIDPDGLTLTGIDRPEVTTPPVRPQLTADTAVFDALSTEGHALRAALRHEACSDGMSDRVYPYAAVVETGGETLKGCAAPADFFARGGEGG